MSLSDRSGKKNNEVSKISFLSDRSNSNTEKIHKNSKIRLSNEEVESIRSSRKSNSNSEKSKKKSIIGTIVHYIVPEGILNKQICLICEESYLLTQLIDFGSCKHSFCESCLKQYAIFKLNNFQLIECPFEGCKTSLEKNTHLYDRILTNEERIKHTKMKRELEILANPNLKSCKDEKCPGILNFSQENKEQIKGPEETLKCPECELQYCLLCMEERHEGKCEKQMVKFLEKNKKFRQCKRCKRVIEKSEGCTHMTCLCGFYFCYMCGEELRGGEHECKIPENINCLEKVRWDIEHLEMFYETSFLSFHRCFYFINFSSQKPLIVRMLFSLLYTLTIYPITVVISILLTVLFFVLLTIFLMLVFLFLPLGELCNTQDYCLTQTIADKLGIYGLALCLFLFYPIFMVLIMIEAVRHVSVEETTCEEISVVFIEIGLGLRNVLMMPLIFCLNDETAE